MCYTEKEAVGPHTKFWMFFRPESVVPNEPLNGHESAFPFCTMLCSTYNHQFRVLSKRPEVVEFREKWRKEIMPEDLDLFIKWVVTEVVKPQTSIEPYPDVFVAIGVALAPFYQTDEIVRDYVKFLERSTNLMKFAAERILNEQTQSNQEKTS